MKSPKSIVPASDALFFKGRPGDARLGEWVEPVSPETLAETRGRETLALFGSPDDLGVVLNRGRAGAKGGPDSIRKYLYKMAMPMDFAWEELIRLVDLGNTVVSDDILATHERARAGCRQVGESGATLVALGGGHDFAAPHLLGFLTGRRERLGTKYKLGLVNVDPHLDVRELENEKPHSGTPFRQILESGELKGKSFVELGARANRNARAHFEYCRAQGVTVLTLETIRARGVPVAKVLAEVLKTLGRSHTELAVTFDMDACSDSEGTSAAPVIGFHADELYEMAQVAGRHPQVRYCELAEVAPGLDPAERSSRIASEMVYAFAKERALSFARKKQKGKARGSAR